MRHVEVSIPAADEQDSIDARVTPTGSLENLSQQEVDRLLDSSRGGLYDVYRRCSLAVLNAGGETDDARVIFERFADFDILIERKAWGIKLDLRNAPAGAFVDGRMIRGIQEHLFAVLRDVLYIHGEVYEHGSVALEDSAGLSPLVCPGELYQQLLHARNSRQKIARVYDPWRFSFRKISDLRGYGIKCRPDFLQPVDGFRRRRSLTVF